MNNYARNMMRLVGDEPQRNGYGKPEPMPLGRTAEGAVEIPSHVKDVPPILAMAEAEEPEPREYLLEGLVPEGAATAIFGAGGVAKSLLAMSLATAVAWNDPGGWMGREVSGGAALYLDFELTQDEQIRRVKSLCRGAGYPGPPPELYYMSAVGHDAEAAFWGAYRACETHGVDFIVVDSYGLAMQGDAIDTVAVLDFYKRMLEPFIVEGRTVLLVDHQAKGGERYSERTLFGSAYKRNTVRSELQLEKLEQNDAAGAIDLLIRHQKSNFGPQQKSFGARVQFADDEIRVSPHELSPHRLAQEDSINPMDRVLIALDQIPEREATTTNIANYVDLQQKSVNNILFSLKNRGKAESFDRGSKWRATSDPHSFTRSRA